MTRTVHSLASYPSSPLASFHPTFFVFRPRSESASTFSSSSPPVPLRLGLASSRLASFLRLVEKSSVVNGNSGFIVPLQTMPGNIIKTFRRNILMLTHRFTVRQTFRSNKLLRLCVCHCPCLLPSLALSPSLPLSPFSPSLPVLSSPILFPLVSFRDFKSRRRR